MKYFILAGEASGDKQAALLCQALIRQDPSAVILGWGGEAMSGTGASVLKHYRELAFMGFVEVVRHLPAIMRNFKTARKQILDFAPDALILVDYPGFNLRMARWAAQQHIPVFYYISPQLWAWHTSRVKTIRKAVRRMFVILPFERAFYRQHDMDVTYIGHPLAMEVHADPYYQYQPQKDNIALLPGSRKHEVERILPEMAALIQGMPSLSFTCVAVPHLPVDLYTKWLGPLPNASIVIGNMKQVLGQSELAIVTSGTATLETALLGVPQIVVYKGSPLSYQIAKRLIKVKYISLVNLVADEPLVPELIQDDCNAAHMKEQISRLRSSDVAERIKARYLEITELLLSGGGADTAAKEIISDLGRQ